MLQAVQSAREFAPDVQHQIIIALAEAYNLQMKILIGFSALQISIIGMIWRKGNQIRVVDTKKIKARSSNASSPSDTLVTANLGVEAEKST